MPETASRVPETRNRKIMKKMYKKPEIETMVVNTSELMDTPGGGSPVGGEYDPLANPAPGRATSAGDPF